mgnify:CR=1 FL=1
MKDPDQPYLDRGFPNRQSYLNSLSERYGFNMEFINELSRYFKTPKDIDKFDEIMKLIGDDKFETI